jgi:hypothetical protein
MPDLTLLPSSIRDPQRLPMCCICNNPVLLETSKTDEYGQALHEECYVLKICSKEEWYVLKLWLKADFLNHRATYAGQSRSSTRSPNPVKRRWQKWGSRQHRNARRACDTLIQRVKHVPWHMWPWSLERAALVTVLLLVCWMVYGNGRPASSLGSLDLQKSNAVGAQIHRPPAMAMPARAISMLRTASVSGEPADTADFLQRVGGENDVVHIGDDVTVRYFTTKAARTASGSGRQVSSRYFGDDVTVRYFTPAGRSATD